MSFYKYPFGRDKDKFLHECGKSSLAFYVKNLRLNDKKYAETNTAIAKECLSLLDDGEIYKILESINPTHPSFQLCNDALNSRTDAKLKKKENSKKSNTPERDSAELLNLLRERIEKIYEAASEARQAIEFFSFEEKNPSKNSQESPF